MSLQCTGCHCLPAPRHCRVANLELPVQKSQKDREVATRKLSRCWEKRSTQAQRGETCALLRSPGSNISLCQSQSPFAPTFPWDRELCAGASSPGFPGRTRHWSRYHVIPGSASCPSDTLFQQPAR